MRKKEKRLTNNNKKNINISNYKIKILILIILILILGLFLYNVVKTKDKTININNMNNTNKIETQNNIISKQNTEKSNLNNDNNINSEDNANNSKEAIEARQLLLLVNFENKIPDNINIELVNYQDKLVSKYMSKDLYDMINDAKEKGYNITITSAYRTKEEQEKLYNDKIKEYLNIGMKNNEAIEFAEKEVAKPGYSEHETGLAVDLSIEGDENNKSQVWNYLKQNSYKFGFINRYPEEKEKVTKIKYEPWHFRYVGKDNAKDIVESKLCLEEYLKRR